MEDLHSFLLFMVDAARLAWALGRIEVGVWAGRPGKARQAVELALGRQDKWDSTIRIVASKLLETVERLWRA